MTPNDILLYSPNNVLFSHHQRSFLLQQMGTNTETDVIQSVRDLETLNLKWEFSNKSLPFFSSGYCVKEEAEDCKSQRGWIIPKKHCLPDSQD